MLYFERQLNYIYYVRFKGPLLLPSFACRPGRKSSLSSQEEKEKQEEEASLLLFLEDCLARPLGKTLPKSYYRIRSNCEDVNAIIAKSSFTSKLLVSLLKLMITQTNGQVCFHRYSR